MGRLGTWVALGLLVLVAALIAGIATHKASPGPSGWVAGISLFVLGATLLAVLWYSLETRWLVRVQRDAAEITDHPWLSAMWLEVVDVPPSDAALFGGVQACLPIKNVGRTPAMLRQVSVSSPVHDRSSDWTVDLWGDNDPRTLAPGERVIVKIADVAFGDLTHPTLYVNVSIRYRTIHGGTGHIVLRYRFEDRGWKSRDTDYECTLSSGLTLPRPEAPSAEASR